MTLSDLAWVILFLLILPFGVVPFFGAPYVPSKYRLLIGFLKQLKVKEGQTLVDLGSGDGGVVKHVANTLGLKAIGIELNPFLVWFTRLRLLRLPEASVKQGNIWKVKIPAEADIIYAFIMPKYMPRLAKKLETELTKPVVVVTYSFKFEGRRSFADSNGFYAYKFQPLAKK